VVQRTENPDAGVQEPILTRTNYKEWSMLMQVNFEATGWCYTVEPLNDDYVKYRHDCLALSPPSCAQCRRTCCPRCGRRGALLRRHGRRSRPSGRVGVDRIREANAQQLRREFNALVWKDSETAEDFANRINGLASDLRILGDNVTDVKIVRKMLRLVPKHLAR
jgi:hypothetical protein